MIFTSKDLQGFSRILSTPWVWQCFVKFITPVYVRWNCTGYPSFRRKTIDTVLYFQWQNTSYFSLYKTDSHVCFYTTHWHASFINQTIGIDFIDYRPLEKHEMPKKNIRPKTLILICIAKRCTSNRHHPYYTLIADQLLKLYL